MYIYRVYNLNINRVFFYSNAIVNIFWVSENKFRVENFLNDGLNVC